MAESAAAGRSGFAENLTILLEPAAGYHIQPGPGHLALKNLHQSLLALMANDDVHKIFAQRLRGEKTGVPSAENDRYRRIQLAHQAAGGDRIADHRSGKQ